MPTASAASWSSCSIVKPSGTYTRVPGASTLRNSQKAHPCTHAQTRANTRKQTRCVLRSTRTRVSQEGYDQGARTAHKETRREERRGARGDEEETHDWHWETRDAGSGTQAPASERWGSANSAKNTATTRQHERGRIVRRASGGVRRRRWCNRKRTAAAGGCGRRCYCLRSRRATAPPRAPEETAPSPRPPAAAHTYV